MEVASAKDFNKEKTSRFYKEIQKENDYYKSIIENNSFYIIKTDLEGRYTYLNPFFCQMLGLEAEDWIGKDSLGIIIPEDHGACINAVMECFQNPGQSHWVVLRKPGAKGIISTQWEFKMITDDEGRFLEILSIGHDITSLILRQEELETLVGVTAEQNKRLVNFTYIVSHNIRSHVANIIGIINLNDMDDSMDDKTALQIINKSTKSLDETIHNLNDIITIQSNTNLPLNNINIHSEISRIVQSIAVLVTNAGTTINYLFDKNEHLKTNSSYFESIILNLITNALKYKTPDIDLVVDLDVYIEGVFKVITFKDNGIGIDVKKYRDRLFGMYNTFHGNKDARGMGLFIIKTQIEAMKGKIEIESEAGKGTTFKIYFNQNAEKLSLALVGSS
ncbi:MAG TPA: PAS domain-containing sensor histidine kinase [Segetibacter sp.]|jgi:PAS domain S-box-containing protein